MGNRAVIAIQQDETDENNFVLLYGHHSGGDNLNAVLETMKRTDRIGDPAYLTAQIFYEFARFGHYNGELGFGIYTGGREAIDETDNPAVFVNPYDGVITYQGLTVMPICEDFAADSFALDYGDGIDGRLFCTTCQHHKTAHTNPA